MLSARFERALQLAARLHLDQRRKGTGIPYVAHLLSVAGLALEHGADEDEAIAALLHDAVEDQGGAPTLDAIRAAFGARVAGIVEGCTDAGTIPKPPWRPRKEAYVAHLRSASRSIQLVSGCDKLHNARALVSDYREVGEELWDRFSGGREGTLWYYREIVKALYEINRLSRLVDELDRTVSELERMTANAAW